MSLQPYKDALPALLSDAFVERVAIPGEAIDLVTYTNQVGGHTTTEGKPTALKDANGLFYKPVQSVERFRRERAFYRYCQLMADNHEAIDASLRSVLQFVPRYFGFKEAAGVTLLALEDVCHAYKRPNVLDVKVGFRTWYSWADDKYIQKCRVKDACTTQGSLGFRICGLQVYEPETETYHRLDRHAGKSLDDQTTADALHKFATQGKHVGVQDIYGGERGAIAQLSLLKSWFETQSNFMFFASSVLIIYEGEATSASQANVQVKLVDFAHVWPGGGIDDNVLRGLDSLQHQLRSLLGSQSSQSVS